MVTSLRCWLLGWHLWIKQESDDGEEFGECSRCGERDWDRDWSQDEQLPEIRPFGEPPIEGGQGGV